MQQSIIVRLLRSGESKSIREREREIEQVYHVETEVMEIHLLSVTNQKQIGTDFS